MVPWVICILIWEISHDQNLIPAPINNCIHADLANSSMSQECIAARHSSSEDVRNCGVNDHYVHCVNCNYAWLSTHMLCVVPALVYVIWILDAEATTIVVTCRCATSERMQRVNERKSEVQQVNAGARMCLGITFSKVW